MKEPSRFGIPCFALATILVLLPGADAALHAAETTNAGKGPLVLSESADVLSTRGANRHGPYQTQQGAAQPKHAYSPFSDAHKETGRQPTEKDYSSDRVLFKLAATNHPAATARYGAVEEDKLITDTLDRHGLKKSKRVFADVSGAKRESMVRAGKPDLTRWNRATIPPGKTVAEVLNELRLDPAVEVAEPDLIRRMAVLPDASSDPKFSEQWHLAAIHAPEAWAYLQTNGLPPGGSSDIVVAVIDTGVDLNHPDLAANLWTGQNGEHGRDVITGSNNPMDDNGHGTHVAGIIAATGLNQEGGVGVAYGVKIMAIKAAQYSGVLTVSDIASAIYYAVDHGADVINMSFGGYFKSQVEEDALVVAFGQAVLVAAAGNDGIDTPPYQSGCDPFGVLPHESFYPAAYNWVLGVEASKPQSDALNGFRAPFSNFDCVPDDLYEYEVLAPGVDVLSTLPDAEYAAWSGTSMAAPVVSGIAALLRTKFADKNAYSSRFIMGQIASQAANPGDPGHKHVVNALELLTTSAEPRLSYLQHWIFDSPAQSSINNNNGIVDSGETIAIGLLIRNQWGNASQVTVKLEPIQEGAFAPDPYVTMLISNVNYGSLGAFNQKDNGLTNDAQGVLAGVTNPFRFEIATNTPNDHVIPFRVTMTCRNGLNTNDATQFSFVSHFSVLVQRGRQVPRIISSDFTLTPDYYWLLNRSGGGTLVEGGATLRIMPGTQVEFTTPLVLARGATLLVEGSAENPVELFASPFAYWGGFIAASDSGHRIEMRYARVQDISFEPGTPIDIVDHCSFSRTHPTLGGKLLVVRALSNSVFHYMPLQSLGFFPDSVTSCLFDHCFMKPPGSGVCSNSTFLLDFGEPANPGNFRNNAFLNRLDQSLPLNWKAQGYQCPTNWMCFMPGSVDLSSNYWGTTLPGLIKDAIVDFEESFTLPEAIIDPILTNPPAACYPFISDLRFRNLSGQISTIVGAEQVTFEVEFNRDMNTNRAPQVGFGPADPYTDFTVSPIGPGWTNARVWVGSFTVSPLTGDGFHYVRIAGAVAADDPWLVTGNDAGRFHFEIRTATSESLNLQAVGREGSIDLSWTQDDFDLLAGFNLYRSTSTNGGFSRINATMILPEQRNWRDVNVTPGQVYYYKFTVVKTDLAESDFSNLASAAALDTIPPIITDTPLTSAQPGLPLTIFADVTDNVGVQSVTLYFRAMNISTYTTRSMTRTIGNRYAATVEGSRLLSPGIEYYIEAGDGVSAVRSGRPEAPYRVLVNDRPVITAITPTTGPASGGTSVSIGGSNFKPGASVSFGGALASNIVVANSSQINCMTPPHFPASVDVTVSNTNGGSGTALNAFTYQSDIASLSLPNTGGAQQTIVQVPVNIANVNGLAAGSFTITFSSAILRGRTARTGNLTPSWSIVANTNTPGQMRISMASSGGTSSGAGVLAYLEFEVVGAPESSTALSVLNVSLNDGAAQVQTANGSFTVNRVYSVSGTVRYWNGNGGVPGVLTTLQGDKVYSASSGTNGAFTVSGAEAGSYALVPSKSDDANAISAFDASLVLQHDVGLIPLTGAAAVAADVNKSGQITSFDAYYILQKAVDSIALPFPGAGKVWDFQPGSRAISGLSSDQSGQDFTAILLGDVSGNWTPSPSGGGGPAHLSNHDPVVVTLKKLVTSHPPATNVWLVIKSTAPDVYAMDLTLTYNPATTQVRSIATAPLGQMFAMARNTNQPGVIRVALAAAVPLQGIGGILSFDVSGSSNAVLQLAGFSINEGAVTAQVDPTGATLDLDSDGDGQSDWNEIRAGTNPLLPQSFLGIASIRINGSGATVIEAFSVPGGIYQLKYKNNLSDPAWLNAAGEVTATGSMTTFTDSAPDNRSRIYRVQLVE